MSQKVQFISTVISAPQLVILDEPFSGLDPVNLEVLRQAILDLNRAGTTVIFSTHDMTVAEQIVESGRPLHPSQRAGRGGADRLDHEPAQQVAAHQRLVDPRDGGAQREAHRVLLVVEQHPQRGPRSARDDRGGQQHVATAVIVERVRGPGHGLVERLQ